jgi:oligoribonuclease NrnB/cAMP/cGMP phosphodiesterase (DHH superfamily)
MKCFYHSADLDGHCSGAIVKHHFPECELIGINYGQPFPWERIDPEEEVFMVDFRLQPFEGMERLNGACPLTWIDHHKSAIEEARKRCFIGSQGQYLGEGKAGCELTWEYLSTEEIPPAVRLLGRYDVWDHTDPQVLPFQYGMRLYNTDPTHDFEFWRPFFEPDQFPSWTIDGILWKGEAVLAYQKQENEKYARACAFETELNGLRFIAVNKMLGISQVFYTVYDPVRHDAMLTFGRRKGCWHVSLYSAKDTVDVSVIAKAYGGGGHKGASGFQCEQLPFSLNGG